MIQIGRSIYNIIMSAWIGLIASIQNMYRHCVCQVIYQTFLMNSNVLSFQIELVSHSNLVKTASRKLKGFSLEKVIYFYLDRNVSSSFLYSHFFSPPLTFFFILLDVFIICSYQSPFKYSFLQYCFLCVSLSYYLVQSSLAPY